MVFGGWVKGANDGCPSFVELCRIRRQPSLVDSHEPGKILRNGTVAVLALRVLVPSSPHLLFATFPRTLIGSSIS